MGENAAPQPPNMEACGVSVPPETILSPFLFFHSSMFLDHGEAKSSDAKSKKKAFCVYQISKVRLQSE